MKTHSAIAVLIFLWMSIGVVQGQSSARGETAVDYQFNTVNSRESIKLAGDPSTPEDILANLSESTNRQVLAAILNNKSCPSNLTIRALRYFAFSRSARERQIAARDIRLNTELADVLAKDPNVTVRAIVAANEATPFPVLTNLANDSRLFPSSNARDNLQKRFPDAVAVISSQWKPLEELSQTDLIGDFRNAVNSGNESKARELMNATDDPETRVSDQEIIETVLATKYFDRFAPLLEQVVKRNGVSVLEDDFVFYRMRPEHIVWMDKLGFLSKRIAPRFLVLAAQRGDGQMVKALLNTQEAKDFSGDTKQHALYAATHARCLECVDELLNDGAKPYEGMQFISDETERIPAVEIAATQYWIAGLKQLDQQGKYQQRIADFEKEFPPTTNSPFLGFWENNQDGFYLIHMQLSPDATGTIGGSFTGGYFGWKSKSNGIELALISKNGIENKESIFMGWDTNKNELVWIRTTNSTERFHRSQLH